MLGMEEKLQHCEQKLQFLKEQAAARPEDSTDEQSEVRGPSVALGTHSGPSQTEATQAILPQQGHREEPWGSSAPHGHPWCLGCNTHLPSST